MDVPQYQSLDISIHALLAESDPLSFYANYRHLAFLSTLSLRRATTTRQVKQTCRVFLSTLSLRRATKQRLAESQQQGAFSIHALLAESDISNSSPYSIVPPFLSTLSLRRATFLTAACIFLSMPFLSTLSLRRATLQ